MEDWWILLNSNPSRFANFIVSPAGCAAVSYFIFVLSWLMPSEFYSSIVREPNFMHLNLRLWIFVTLCTAAFILGGSLVPGSGGAPSVKLDLGMADRYLLAIALLLALAIGLNVLSALIIFSNSGNIIGRILSGGGATAKATLNTEGALTEALPFLYGVVWWASARIAQISKSNSALYPLVKLLISVAIGVGIFVAVLKLARFEIVPFFIGIFICVNRFKILTRAVTWRYLILVAVFFPILILSIFFIFSALRGNHALDQQFASFLGYGPASFNRLAAMIEGGLIYPYGGRGYYIVGFLTKLPLVQNVIDVGAMLGLPSRASVFLSEFDAVRRAGFSSQFIWSTTFGYFYSDIGYWTVAFMLFVGLCAKKAWISWRRGEAAGLVLYPFIAGTIILWGTGNLLVQPRLTTFVGTALLVVVCESLLLGKFARGAQAPRRT